MQFKSLFFNRGLFHKQLTRFWPIFLLSTLFWMVGLSLTIAASVVNGSPQYLQIYADSKVAFWAGECYLVAFGDAIVCAMAVFSYQFNPRAALAIHAMPIRREGLFFTSYLAGLALMLFPLTVGLLAAIVTEAALGVLNLSLLLLWFTAQIMADLIFFSLAAFCAQLTGNLIAFPALYGGLQLVPWMLSTLITAACSTLLRGFHSFPMMEAAAQWCAPLWKLMVNVSSAWRKTGENTRLYFLRGWKCLFCYLLVSLVLAAAALALYRRRQVETAGDIIAIPVLRPVFRYFFTVICAICFAGVLTAVIFSSDLALWSWKHVAIYLGLLVVGGFLGYFSAQMMLQKTLQVFRTGWGGYGACMLALVALVCALKGDVFRFASWLPEADQVEQVELVNTGITLEGEEAIAQVVRLHAALVEDLDGAQQQVQDYYTAVNSSVYDSESENCYIDGMEAEDWYASHNLRTVILRYHLYGGMEYARAYTIYLDEAQLEDTTSPAYQLKALMNLPEYFQSRYEDMLDISLSEVSEVGLSVYCYSGEAAYASTYVTLTDENARQVVSAFWQDLREGNLEEKLLDAEGESWSYSWSSLEITTAKAEDHLGDSYSDTVSVYPSDATSWYYVELNESWTNTLAALTDLGVLDENHFLANDQLLQGRSYSEGSERYDEVSHSYVESPITEDFALD